MSKEYGVIAGSKTRPEHIEYGRLEKGTGQTQTLGNTVKGVARRGDVYIPNYTEFWGARLDANGKIPDSPLDVKSTIYKGQVKELPWGDPKGYLIMGRYLKGYQTIDLQYQDIILGAKLRDEDDVFYLYLQTGDNFYDPESDKYLVQMMRCHYLNESCKYKNPDTTNSMFSEFTNETTETTQTKVINLKFEALKIVNEASQDNSNAKLKNLYSVMAGVADETIKENDLYKYFSLMADETPEKFMTQIEAYNRSISDAFSKAVSFDMLDVTRDGFILLGEEGKKKDIVAEGVPAKGEKMKDWVMNNYLETKAFEVAFKVKQFTDKIK